ncbi:MAG: hypothetical protein ACYCVV_20545, partial [Acidimicrobiales bacterium]
GRTRRHAGLALGPRSGSRRGERSCQGTRSRGLPDVRARRPEAIRGGATRRKGRPHLKGIK